MARLIEVEWNVPEGAEIEAIAFDTPRDAYMAGFGKIGYGRPGMEAGFRGGGSVNAPPTVAYGATGWVPKFRRRQRRK